MRVLTIGRLAIGFALATALTGCIDADVDVALTGPATARTSIVQTMGADFFAMLDANAEKAKTESSGFCQTGELTRTKDGGAICTEVEEGAFDALAVSRLKPGLQFTKQGPDTIRITLPLAALRDQIGAGETADRESRQMIEAFFAGRTITIHFSGKTIGATNMKRSDDGKSATEVLPFLDLINGTGDLPQTLYAVVEAP